MSDTARTVLVTGATSGIGLETARRLAAQQATVLMHARSADEGEQALEELVKTGTDPLRLKVAVADFTRLEEVRELAERVGREHPRLDVLVNNAETAGPDGHVVTRDGHELTLQVNYLAPYLLTRLLWEPLMTGPAGRVINVSSSLHRSGHLHWGDFNHTRRYSRVAAYTQSKLALTMFTKGLAEYAQNGPVAVAVHPGVALMGIYGRIGGPVGEGATAVVHLAAPATTLVNGAYYNRLSVGHAAPLIQDRTSIGRLWKLSARLTGMA
jgi:NAD(P)-dependent dehydrogenase (short-subunit alcohol dehydrogenase family)